MKYKYKLKERAYQPQSVDSYQAERINVFTDVEARLNNLYKLLDQAKEETIQYYNSNPNSYAVVYGTDLIQDYLADIENLLTPNKQ